MNISGVKLTRLVDAATEPIALSDAVNWLRVEISDDNSLISDLITAARLECEQLSGRSFIATTWQLTIDYLPMSAGPFPGFPWPFGGGSGYPGRLGNNGVITLPMPPLISVSSVEYLDYSGVLQTLSPSAYLTNPGTPGTLFPTFGTFFPLSQPIPSAVKIAYVAGYGPDASFVPKSTMLALRFLVAHYYNHRTSNVEVPDAVQNLLDIDRAPRSG
jgi:hypothetical protein